MTARQRNTTGPMVAIEICRGWVHLVRVKPARHDGALEFRTRSVRWSQDAETLYSERSARELSVALETLATEEKLAGATVDVALNGDYCVTRVVSGAADHVQSELASLQRRSRAYVSLGPGRKSLATSIRSLDARHQHALVTVANAGTLDALAEAAADAGLKIRLVEPMLVALCRLVKHAGFDTDGPVLVINLGESGVELGISYQGHLLLDYRLGRRFGPAEVAGVVLGHLARLRRYCTRYHGCPSDRLQRVFLCGAPEPVRSARDGFGEQDELTVEVLDPTSIDASWRFSDADCPGRHCGALGTCLAGQSPNRWPRGPNLLERSEGEDSQSLMAGLCRTFWPVAAAVLLALGLLAAGWHERSRCHDLIGKTERLDSQAAELWRVRLRMAEDERKAGHLESIAGSIADPPWSRVLSTLARCMPEDVWLDKLTADSDGQVTLVGNGLRDEAVYDVVRNLEPCPGVSRAAVEGTRAGSSPSGTVTKFDIQLSVKEYADWDKEAENED